MDRHYGIAGGVHPRPPVLDLSLNKTLVGHFLENISLVWYCVSSIAGFLPIIFGWGIGKGVDSHIEEVANFSA